MDATELVKVSGDAASQIKVDGLRDIAFVKILDHLIRIEETERMVVISKDLGGAAPVRTLNPIDRVN